jgi:hypothetical protein
LKNFFYCLPSDCGSRRHFPTQTYAKREDAEVSAAVFLITHPPFPKTQSAHLVQNPPLLVIKQQQFAKKLA